MDKKGFTLIEVLVGMVLLAIGLLAIAGMQVTSVKGNFLSSNITQASVLAQDRLEALRQLPIDHGDLDIGKHDEGKIGGTVFSREYVVVLVPGTTMRSITATVRWTDKSNHAIAFTTMRAE